MFEKELRLIEAGCGFSTRADAFEAGAEAARHALRSIRQYPISVLLVFASPRFEPEALLEGIGSVAGHVPVIGASTAGEICDGLRRESVVVAALASPYLKVHSAVGRNVSTNWQAAVEEAAGSSEIRPFFPSSDPTDEPFSKGLRREGKSIFGLLFSPGNTRTANTRSRDILLALRERCQRLIPFCGGSSADDWRLDKNHVFHHDRVYEDGMLVAIFETQLKNGMGLAHGFSPSDKKLLVTRVRENVVLEINHRRADEAYGECSGVSLADMKSRHLTLATGNPVGLAGPYGEFAINVATFLTKNGGIRFSQPVAEGAQLTVMNADPDAMIDAGKQAFQKALFRGGINRPAIVLVFSCALRSHILKERTAEEVNGIRDLARNACVAGFLSFGEQGLSDDGGNCHGNELVSVLAIGTDLTPAAEVWFENQQLLKEKEWAEKALMEANAFREAVIEHVGEGLCVFHEIDRYPYIRFDIWNERMTEITGYRMDEINRLQPHQPGHPISDIQDKAMTIVARLRAGDDLRGEEWIITGKNGTKRTVAVSTNTLALKENKVHVLAVIYDLTRQKQAESERLALEMRAQHVQKLESLGVMAGGIAHDFNNILMVILGNIELAQGEAPESSSLRSYLGEMEKSVFMAADLTRKILAYTGKTPFVITTANLSDLGKEAYRTLADSLPDTIDLHTRLTPKLPSVKVDAAMICQVVTNLVVNSAEAYGPEKGGRITVSTGTLYCDADYLAHTVKDVTGYENPPPEGMYVFLEVADTACGMDEVAASRVFDPFFTTKFQGRGLGLSTVLGIARGLNGAIRLESAVGKGTTIRVLFPAVTEDGPVRARNAANLTTGEKHGERTVLLVDDELKIRKLARTMLERLGYQVFSAANGQEAIRIYHERYQDIHCVLLDLSMPEMSGKEVFNELRRLDPSACVILSSGYTEQDVMAMFEGDRPAGFIQKPYRFQMLSWKMKKILDGIASASCSISDL